tara:strand:- start:19578 stop:20342 length:765 start_codon:yes stop_codon:yes gene_type:complete
MRILSWNVNGLRAVHKKGFLDWLYQDSPDVLCVQETKAQEENLDKDLHTPEGYYSYYASADKKGYSGVAIYTKEKPEKVEYGIGIQKFDIEGRTLIAHYKDFSIITAYFPSTGRPDRVSYKLEFDDAILELMQRLAKDGKKIIMCGDLNVAHEEIDLARPKENDGRAGFMPEERAWADELTGAGFIDTFRHIYPEKRDAYTWWDVKSRARDRNVGWRLDYFFISPNLLSKLKHAFILDHIMGSDHAPVGIEVSI